jgi:hypothetical protein
MRIQPGASPANELVQGARATITASMRDLRDTILRDLNRQRASLGLPRWSLDAAQGAAAPTATGAAPSKQDDIVEVLEGRISAARMSPRQKELLRRFAAVSLKDLKKDKDLSKVFRSVLAMVEAWEFAERDQPVKAEGPGKIKRIADYLEELAANERAAGKTAAAYQKARSAQRAATAERPAAAQAAKAGAAVQANGVAASAADKPAANIATGSVGSVVDVRA